MRRLTASLAIGASAGCLIACNATPKTDSSVVLASTAPVPASPTGTNVLAEFTGTYDAATGKLSMVYRRPGTHEVIPETLVYGQGAGDAYLHTEGTNGDGKSDAPAFDNATQVLTATVDAENGTGGDVQTFTATITSISASAVGMVTGGATTCSGASVGGGASAAPCTIAYGTVPADASFPTPVFTNAAPWTFYAPGATSFSFQGDISGGACGAPSQVCSPTGIDPWDTAIAYWSFDGDDLDRATDPFPNSAGSVLNGASTNPLFVPGLEGQAHSWTAGGGQGAFKVSSGVDLRGFPFTIEAWIQLTSIPAGVTSTLFTETLNRSAGQGGAFAVRGTEKDGALSFAIGSSTVTSATKLSTQQWHHVAFAYDDVYQTMTIYLDGAVYATGSGGVPQLPASSVSALSVGSGLVGMMDELRIFQHVRRATDIATDATLPSSCANLASDNKNCGGCGNVCRDGTACVAGVCAACSPGQGVPGIGHNTLKQCGSNGQWLAEAACPAGAAVGLPLTADRRIAWPQSYQCNANPGNTNVQNLVVLIGSNGAHAYPQLIFPHPDDFEPGRSSSSLPVHFLQSTATGGTPTTFGGRLSNTTDYDTPPPAVTINTVNWSAGQRYQQVFGLTGVGVGNQAFGGYLSPDSTSASLDQAYYGTSMVPTNVDGDATKRYLVTARETPWLGKYGLKKGITSIDGGKINPFPLSGTNNAWIDVASGTSVLAAAAVAQGPRSSLFPVIIRGNPSPAGGGGASALYGSLAGAPTPIYAPSSYLDIDWALEQSEIDVSSQLALTSADQTRYGFTGSTPAKYATLRDDLITAAKALKLGITSEIVIPYFDEEPTNLFTAGGVTGVGDNAATAAAFLNDVLSAFEDDLMSVPDPFAPSFKLGDNTVILFVGDSPRTNVSLGGGWYDATTGGQNRVWVMSNGLLKTGAFGGDRARFPSDGPAGSNDPNGKGPGEGGLWNLTTGDLLPFDTSAASAGMILVGGVDRDLRTQYGETAMAAVLCAVTRQDLDTVNTYYKGPTFPAAQIDQ